MPDRVLDGAKAVVVRATGGALAGHGLTLVERLAPWRRGTLTVLTYHRVDVPEARPDLMPSLISATPDGFAAHIETLRERWRTVSLAEALAALPDPRRLPPKAVLVTFDDAYADFATHAWPALRAAGVPVTLFVPTAFPGGEAPAFWWDRLWAAIRQTERTDLPDGAAGNLPLASEQDRRATLAVLRTRLKALDHATAMHEVEALIAALGQPADDPPGDVLSWDELRRLAAEGVTLAPHTRTHPLLDRVSLVDAVAEIEGAWTDLEREIGPTPRALAYPSGAHGGAAVEAARRSGMELAFTTRRGGNDLRRSDPLRLRRINVGAGAKPPHLRAQVVWASAVDRRPS